MQEKIEIEYQAINYEGYYSVEGTNSKQLTVYYRGQKRVFEFDYRAEQPGYVESLAGQLLLEMAKEESDKLLLEAETKEE